MVVKRFVTSILIFQLLLYTTLQDLFCISCQQQSSIALILTSLLPTLRNMQLWISNESLLILQYQHYKIASYKDINNGENNNCKPKQQFNLHKLLQ